MASGTIDTSQPQRHISLMSEVPQSDPDCKSPRLSERLPNVECIARARMPTTFGMDLFLHVYQNDVDDKEHMAIVFGDNWKSSSLYRERDGDTEADRVIRGAYPGRVTPETLKFMSLKEGHAQSTDIEDTITRLMQHRKIEHDNQISLGAGPSEQCAGRGNRACVASDATDQAREDAERLLARASPDAEAPFVRIHSECCTGEMFWSTRCDCGEQLDEAARVMCSASSQLSSSSFSPATTSVGGIIIYLRQEGRGIGLASKLKACNLQDLGFDTVDANLLLREPVDGRSYGVATSILLDLGCGGERGIRLLTNNLDKVRAVESSQRAIKVKERIAMTPLAWKTDGRMGIHGKEIQQYLHTKVVRMGHMMGENKTGIDCIIKTEEEQKDKC